VAIGVAAYKMIEQILRFSKENKGSFARCSFATKLLLSAVIFPDNIPNAKDE